MTVIFLILLEKYNNFSPLSHERLSPFINNVSGCIEESLLLHPAAAYKEKFRCRSQERRDEVVRFSRTGLDLRNSLQTKIGCVLKRRALVSAGPGSDPASHSSRISSQRLQHCSFMQFHHPHRGIFLPARRPRKAEIVKHAAQRQ